MDTNRGGEGPEKKRLGLAGRVASAFIDSKLTPLLVVAALLLGVFAVIMTPREEEPQIRVPMIDVFVGYPGASAKEVESRVTTPMEKIISEVEGVEYVYSMASHGRNLTIVRFYVGTEMETAIVRLYNELMSNYDRIPPGVTEPLVKPRSIFDVPVFTTTLWSKDHTGYELRNIAGEVALELKKDADVSEVTVTGGRKRELRVDLDPARLRAYSTTPLEIMDALKGANARFRSGTVYDTGTEFVVDTGSLLEDASDVGSVVVGVRGGSPVYLRDMADVTDGPEEPSEYVFMGLGPAAGEKGIEAAEYGPGDFEAVTLAVAKKKGANATFVARGAEEKLHAMEGVVIPEGVEVTVTRNYGETAKEKSDELLEHMIIATVAVTILIALFLGLRESAVVAVAVPVTLALTLLVNYLYGYTLNRVTLFALIFSIGILVDDAIVVVENIHRHFTERGVSRQTALGAVDEVGNPTILATFTVIAALLPMAFVSGLMGPYMRPIPVGASAAMLFSLLVAFIVSPWLGFRALRGLKKELKGEGERLHALYTKVLTPLLDNRRYRFLVLGAVAALLGLAVLLVPFRGVEVKMLPFDNKSELQVIIDMPEESTLEETAAAARALGEHLRGVPEVTDFQTYVGTSAPFNFNGLVRHYYLRSGPNVADIQVNFVGKDKRADQSHDLAKRLRPGLKKIAEPFGANIKLAEIPPGPPVLSTLVAEVYGPDAEGRLETARKIREVFESTPGVVDVDWYVEDEQTRLVYEVDRARAAEHNVTTEAVARTLRMALGGATAGLAHVEDTKEPVEIRLRMPVEKRTAERALSVPVPTPGGPVPLREVVTKRETATERTIHHKNLRNVVYVTGDVAVEAESPVYAIMDMSPKLRDLDVPGRFELGQYSSVQPPSETHYAMKWDGEWHITYEVFRDLGVAFAAVLVLIYILVVAWFGSFLTPVIIMAPIPLTLVGILPGHWLFGAFFTATSMIGFIALAGISVRNAVLLVDFIEMEWAEGKPLGESVIRAGAVRTRPILLTALTVVVSVTGMLFDPIFSGLAISMMFGAVAATGLTLVAVPLLYYEFFRNRNRPTKATAETED